MRFEPEGMNLQDLRFARKYISRRLDELKIEKDGLLEDREKVKSAIADQLSGEDLAKETERDIGSVEK